MTTAPVLDVVGLSVRYGIVAALDNVTLSARSGQITGLIGPNGAGKTSLIDAVSGFTAAAGRIELDGRDVTGLAPSRRARRGLARTFQSLELFDDLTVWDNLLVAAERPTWWTFLADLVKPSRRSAAEEQANWSLEVMGLQDMRDRLTTDLSHGQRKLVSVARALANRPKLVLLDEPAAGLDTAESQLLGDHLRDFLERDITVFLIDHDMGLVLNVCDYIYVLDFGRIIAHGTPAEIRSNPAVISAYLGESAGELQAQEGVAARRQA